MRPDPLTILVKLRRLQAAAAQATLAKKEAGLRQVEDALSRQEQALADEARETMAFAYAAWLPLAQALLAEREAERAQAARSTAQARAELTNASVSLEAALELYRLAREHLAQERAAAQQKLLDDAGLRRTAAGRQEKE